MTQSVASGMEPSLCWEKGSKSELYGWKSFSQFSSQTLASLQLTLKQGQRQKRGLLNFRIENPKLFPSHGYMNPHCMVDIM